jgi:hypothetical protein
MWALNVKKENFDVNDNKCNKFVYDVTREAGAEALFIGRPPMAAEWANPNAIIPNWRVLKSGEKYQPGDVAAYKLSGGGTRYSGHTGIMTSDTSGIIRKILQKHFPSFRRDNVSAHADAVYPVSGQFSNNPKTIYRRYIGE